MEIKKTLNGSELTVALSGSLDTMTVTELEKELKGSLDGVNEIIFDLADLEYISSEAYTSSMSYFDYMWNYDLSTEIIWTIGFTTTSYGGALGQQFLNFNNDYTYYYPDYVPAQWVLNLYQSTDLRYGSYFTQLQTGYVVLPVLFLVYVLNQEYYPPLRSDHSSD